MQLHKILIGLAVGLTIGSASATVIDLTLNKEDPRTVGPQSVSAPCIIAGTTCQNPSGFAYTNFTQTGSITAYDEFSPEYLISDFPFLSFNVAIDVNTADHGERLIDFWVEVDDGGGWSKIYQYVGPTAIADPLPSNGNGYADWTLRSVDLSAYGPSVKVRFWADWDGATDGAESFFIVSTDAPVPVPATLLLFGVGLLGLGMVRKFRA